jgi:hypothetical protein
MGFGEIIVAIGGSGVLFAAMAWLARSIINHFLSKDLENFKLILQKESQQELMRLQSSLQLIQLEHQVRFTKLHENRAGIIAEIYSMLVKLHRTASIFVRMYQSLDDTKNKENIKQLWGSLDIFTEYFEKHRIYFNQNTCSEIDYLINALSKAVSTLVFFIQEAGAIEVTTSQVYAEWDKAMTIMEGDVPKIKKSLEESFRELLGVLTPISERLT